MSVHLQPLLKEILATEALSEAEVVAGQESLSRPVLQVVYGWQTARAGSLVVASAEALDSYAFSELKDLAGVIVIPEAKAALAGVGGSSVRTSLGVGVDVERVVKVFNEAKTALIILPVLGDCAQITEEIRLAFQSELKKASARLHAHFLSIVLESGLRGLAEALAEKVGRPVAIEAADFKVLASENMGPTPASQQRTLTEEVAEKVQRQMRTQLEADTIVLPDQPVRLGRRLVMPIILEGAVVGYLSVMMRSNDDFHLIAEYMVPATLAALIDFTHRRKEVSTITVTQKSLLKDLLSGRTLSAGDQERLEQHFGFDLCDGFYVLAVQSVPPAHAREATLPEDGLAMVEIENARVFVLPFDSKQGRGWQQEADAVISLIQSRKPELKLQVGVSRVAPTLLDLPDAYREARQSLIIGSMLQGENEFCVEYGQLGIKRLLYLLIDHPELDRFYEESLAPLEAYDVEWEAELVPTLKVYLEQGANLNSAAKELFVHRHTMRYRLEQIAEILSVDIDSPEVLLNLQIAFLIREMKGKSES